MTTRTFPALDLNWRIRPPDEHLEQLLSEIDACKPTAIEDRDNGVRVFFGSTAARANAEALLRAADASVACTSTEVSDEGWAERSQMGLPSVRVGRILIDLGVPAATREEDAAPEPDLVVSIRPSMGFGTGHHATTRLCLQLLQQMPVAGARVVDVGTGSGVLALAAWRLGAGGVTAVDVDPDALASARDNVERNGATGAIALEERDVIAAGQSIAQGPVDLVLANLTGNLLMRLAPRLAEAHASTVIASGFLTREEAAVANALQDAGFRIAHRTSDEDWVGASFTSSPRPSRAR